MRKTLALLVLLLSVTGAHAATMRGRSHVGVDGRRVSFAKWGKGTPVVFESGLGDGMLPWASVFNETSRFATAFAYDRAGYGHSVKSKNGRDGEQVVAELRATLRAVGLAPPYVLVGHSLGGTYMDLYARLHPEEVAALVLVDARPAGFRERCLEEKLRACEVPNFLRAVMPPAARAELESMDETIAQSGRAPKLRDGLPLFVLSSGKHFVEEPAWTRLWASMQAELAARSTASHHQTLAKSGHYIQRDEPKAVVAAIREAVRSVR